MDCRRGLANGPPSLRSPAAHPPSAPNAGATTSPKAFGRAACCAHRRHADAVRHRDVRERCAGAWRERDRRRGVLDAGEDADRPTHRQQREYRLLLERGRTEGYRRLLVFAIKLIVAYALVVLRITAIVSGFAARGFGTHVRLI